MMRLGLALLDGLRYLVVRDNSVVLLSFCCDAVDAGDRIMLRISFVHVLVCGYGGLDIDCEGKTAGVQWSDLKI